MREVLESLKTNRYLLWLKSKKTHNDYNMVAYKNIILFPRESEADLKATTLDMM